MSIEELKQKEASKRSLESYIRGKCMETLAGELQGYNAFEKAGGKWTFPKKFNQRETEEVELSMEEPLGFEKFEESNHSHAEKERIDIPFPERFYDKALECASFANARIIEGEKRGLTSVRPFKTCGDWFKQVVFIPTFTNASFELERDDLKSALQQFDEQEEKTEKAAAKVLTKK